MYRYKKIKLKNGKTIDEHRLIWEQHHGPIATGMVIHHINGIRTDNRIENLELMSLQLHSAYHVTIRGNEHRRKEITHGTVSGYRRGCRCNECKERQRIRIATYRSKTT